MHSISSTDSALPCTPTGRQQGMATLAMALLVLFLSSLMVFQSSSAMLFEIKAGSNRISQARAMEAARGGIETTLAWLSSGAVRPGALVHAGNWDDGQANGSLLDTNIASQRIGDISVDISLWQIASGPGHTMLEIRAITGNDIPVGIQQRVMLTMPPNLAGMAPIVVAGSLGDCGKKKSCITGNPSVSAGDSGVAIMTSASAASNQPGHLSVTGQIQGNAFSGSAWDFVFPDTSKEQMRLESEAQAAAELAAQQAGTSYQRTVYYFDASNIGDIGSQNWHRNVGSPSQPAILVFDSGAGCPKMNGGVVIHGLVYYADSCSKNGWGGATLTGTLAIEGDLTDITANTKFTGWPNMGNPSFGSLPGLPGAEYTIARKTASWRDF